MGTEREGMQVHSDKGESLPTDPQHLWPDFIDFFSPTCISKAVDSLNTIFFLREGKTKQQQQNLVTAHFPHFLLSSCWFS